MSSSGKGMRVSRRETLTAGAAAWLAAAGGVFSPLFAAPNSRWFKIGACEWSLGVSDPSCFALARQIGLDGVQVDLGTQANDVHLRRSEAQEAYLAAAREQGREIASLALAILNQVPLKSDPKAAEYLSASIDVCRALGIRLTMPAFFGAGELDMDNREEIDHVVAVLQEIAPAAEREGVTIGLENYLSAEENLDLIDRIGSPAVKVYYDVGNSTDKGRDIYAEIRLLGEMICEFHAKDGPHLLGEGRIDFAEVRRAIDDIDYSGWIVLEAARPNDLIEDYTAQARFLRRIFPERG